MTEKPAEDVRGFILYNPYDKKYFFRIYRDDKSFTDYNICAEDIEITVHAGGLSLYEDENNPVHNRLDWSSKTLGK